MKIQTINFPDGQPKVTLNSSKLFEENICFRINSSHDLLNLACAADVLGRNNMPASVTIPCLFGQRDDRIFGANESFGMKVIANIINMCNFTSVNLFDPHSDVGPALINRSNILHNLLLDNIGRYIASEESYIGPQNLVIVSPDAGAYKKVFKYAEKFNKQLVAANKFRDNEGKITINFSGNVLNRDCIIIDDICEFGNTFIKLASELKALGANSVSLYVSHFMGGGNDNYKDTIDRMLKTVDRIYTTNSIRDFEDCDNPNFITYMNFNV